ncbi:MAG: hypothetical protein Q8O56_16615 [Solirubrobacteraceae bacterium]|nr:hypothetical protein [Solirubrobacteraceae bacterium]
MSSDAPSSDGSARRRSGAVPVPMPSRQLTIVVGVVLASALVAQLVLGWGLGVHNAWMAILLVAAIAAVLAFVDAGQRGADPASDEPYNWALCAIVGLVIVAAVASLYLPLPWGGLVAAVILAGVVVLGVIDHRAVKPPGDAR